MGGSLDEFKLVFPPAERGPVRDLFGALEFQRFLKDFGGEMKTLSDEQYRCVTTDREFRELIQALRAAELIAIDTETTSVEANRADLVGLSFCVDAERAWYVPVAHTGEGHEEQLPRERVLLYLKGILENPKKRFVGQNLKYDITVLGRAGIRLVGVAGDTLIASYLLNPGRRSHKLDGLALTWLQHKMVSYEEATQDTAGDFAAVGLEQAAVYAAEDAHVALLLHDKMEPALKEAGLTPLYSDVEIPLVSVLSRMERSGVLVDREALEAYSEELGAQIAEAEEATWRHAGRKFNSASPKQLAEILFGELGLPVIKKTKTGPSTDASVLEELASRHELPEAILRFRMLSKLKSTYVDALPPLIHPETGRIHTSFKQTVAATGRLSSQHPNLQNIPIKNKEGRRVRAAFIPADGFALLSADYSQVELRVLAHLCGGEGGFARAFEQGLDVHSMTAADVFEVMAPLVTPQMRRTAKAINFGLIYGQTDYGLARTLRISRKKAAKYIERYKARYPEVDRYMGETVSFAREHGFVRTVLGRRRPITDLSSNNYNQREAAKRTAINTPVQGSAADIIKLAMLAIDEVLEREFPESRMIMQVHDELVFEVPKEQVDRLQARVVQEMERAYPLSVPLVVDAQVGSNWDEAH